MLGRLSVWALLLASFAGGVALERSHGHHGTEIVFVSVGQGDCTVLMSDDWVVVIDVAAKSEGFDAGERLVAPELRKLGVRKIDCLILTHPDGDHIGGLGAVARRFRIGRVLVSQAFRENADMLKALGEAGLRPSQVEWVATVERADFGQLRLTVAPPVWYEGMPTNDGCLFVRADAGEGSAAFTGDANASVEEAMAAKGDWDVQVLKAGHHGSKYSSSKVWLDETTPQVVVASCGRRNNYGHPSPEAIARIKEEGATFLRTDRDGTVVFLLGQHGFYRGTPP